MIKSGCSQLVVLLFGLVLGANGTQALAQTTPNNQLLYELLNRIERLEREIRQLRGDLEVYRYRQDRYEELEHRLRALEGGNPGVISKPQDSTHSVPIYPSAPRATKELPLVGPEPIIIAPSPPPPPPPPPTLAPEPEPAPALASADEQAAYNTAFAHMQEGQYQQAIITFEDFLNDYPNNALTDKAYYWLGQAYYVNRDFSNARDIFLTLGAKYPDSEKLPDTLLKLGYSYEELGDRNRAMQVYTKLMQAYPGSRAASLAEPRVKLLQ